MYLRCTIISVTMLAVAVFGALSAQAQSADIIFSNGKILTADQSFSAAQSLAIRGSKIVAVGTTKDIARHQGRNTRVIDLQGKTVIPGLIDNHFHFIRSVWNYQREVRLDGIRNRTQALELISARAKKAPSGEWITVIGGWSPAQFRDNPGGFTLAELDRVAPNNPLYIQQSYRAVYANTLALRAAGRDPANGAMIRGRRNYRSLFGFISWRNKSSDEKAILDYMAALNRFGLTTIYDVGRPTEGKLAPLARLAAAGLIPLRVFHTLRYRATDVESTTDALNLITKGSVRPISSNIQFGLVGLGEHIYGPMHDRPNRRERWKDDVWESVRTIAKNAAAHDWPIHEHTMSGVTVAQFLDLVEEISVLTPKVKTLRWTLAHSLGIAEPDIARAARLGVAIAVHSQAMMNPRSRNRPPVGTIERSDILWGLGSDGGIVAPINPFMTLAWVVTGLNIMGEDAWSTDQRVSRRAALIAHTRSNARLLFKENQLGSLEIDKLADLVVLDRDYMTVPENQIADIRPIITMVGGRIVYQAKKLDQ